MMRELEILMDRRWVVKEENRQLYYHIRDALPEIRAFATEKMGCQVIDNAQLIKMEKIPAIAETAMGITQFSAREEYAFLCLLLMFLEDRDVGEPFILSQFTEYIVANMPGGGVNWTHYRSRQPRVRVLRPKECCAFGMAERKILCRRRQVRCSMKIPVCRVTLCVVFHAIL